MEDVPKLKIEIKDFRAIKSADIILNGITVIAGVNGCGKSTISKLLYRTIKTSIDFNIIVGENIFKDLIDIRHFLEELSHEAEYFRRANIENGKKIMREEYEVRYNYYRLFNFNPELDLKEQEKKILSSIDSLKKIFVEMPSKYLNEKMYRARFYRLERFFKEEFFEKEKNLDEINIPALLDKLKEKIKNQFQKGYSAIEKRPIKISDDIINTYFTENIIVKNYNIEELGALITNRKDKKLSNFLTINKIAYVDTPMIIGVENIDATHVSHWQDLDMLLKKDILKRNNKNNISDFLKEDIIDGETKYDSKNETFIYKRKDGFKIDLFSCATGLKSFSLLQILFNNGFLDNKTLLIIDEPETHLHPEWIVQYARLIVMLHKELKVNFLIGSHSPDMVSAIKYIAKKELEEDSNSLNFYFAKNLNKYQFEFIASKTDIEPIFESFNISLDKINEYGSSEE